MKEQEISPQTAKLAKLKGFDWECRGYYKPKSRFKDNLQEHFGKFNSNKKQIYVDENGIVQIVEMCSAPTQSLLQRWLRDIHKIFVTTSINPYFQGDLVGYYAQVKSLSSINQGERLLDGFTIFLKIEDSLEEGLFEALKLINDKS
jgi:hypothetical protein